MEFRFDVDRVLPEDIVCTDSSLIIKGWNSSTRNRLEYQQLNEIVNAIGEASSFAQSLNNVITTAERLQNSNHILYLMKENDPVIEKTVVVGMLKIGRKKLFLLDSNQQTREVAPMCILDFYIHESRQRRGYGKKLYDYMLSHQKLHPGHLAVDKPSDRFLFFLTKHYGLTKQVPQINNFIVYEEFFQERPVDDEEAVLTQSARTSRTGSPDSGCSSGSSRRPSATHYAGKPSRVQTSSMTDILQGRPNRHSAAVRRSPRYQTTLDWMRGGVVYESSTAYATNYSASRTPSNAGTPRAPSPPASPPKEEPIINSMQSSPDNLNAKRDEVDAGSVQSGSEGENEVNGEKEDEIVEDMEELTLGKTGNWEDNVSRSSVGLAEHMSLQRGHISSGVLKDDESVAGHLKFHHHALW